MPLTAEGPLTGGAGGAEGGREPLALLPAPDAPRWIGGAGDAGAEGARWVAGAGVPEPDAAGCIGADVSRFAIG